VSIISGGDKTFFGQIWLSSLEKMASMPMILYLLLSVYAAQEAAADEIMAKSISVPDQKNSH